MRKHYSSHNGSVLLGLGFDPVDGPDSDGAVTVSAVSVSLTIDGDPHPGVSGTCTLPPDQNAHPDNASTPYTGTFVFTVEDGATTALSGAVTGSFDTDRIFRAASFTKVALGSHIEVPPDFNRILLPLDADEIAMGTASVIIKPN